jgi:hypothetical protein
MPGQLAVLPAAGGVGAVLDEPESDGALELFDCVELVLEELSLCAHATDAPPPTMVAASASPARACFMRSVMSFTSLRGS